MNWSNQENQIEYQKNNTPFNLFVFKSIISLLAESIRFKNSSQMKLRPLLKKKIIELIENQQV